MDKLKDSLNFIFKERDWVLKLLLPIMVLFLFTVPSILLTTITTSTTTRTPISIDMFMNDFTYNYSYSNSYNNFDTSDVLTLVIGLVTILLIIPTAIIQVWYTYENIQSGIFVRKTTAIWKNKFEDTLKKTAKYFLVSLVYGMIFGALLLFIGLIFFCCFALLVGVLSVGAYNSFDSTYAILFGTAGGLIFLCIGLVVLVVLLGLFYIVYMPAVLRLIATNTLSEAFRFKENWNIGKRHAGEILGIYLVSLVGGIIIGIISGVLSIGSFFFVSMPAINLIVNLVTNYILLVISTFFTLFFLNRYTGLVFRDIIASDETLKDIKLTSQD